MNKTSAINVAKKLKALAEKATGPEADAAKSKLKSYCIKHGIDPEDYSTEITDVFVEFANEQEKRILNNIITMILQSNKVEAEVKKNSVHFKCTPKQLKGIIEAYSYYKKIYYSYADALTIALIAKNKIQHTGSPDGNNVEYEMTAEEKEEFEKIKKDLEAEFKGDDANVTPEASESVTPEQSELQRNKQKEMIERFMFVMEETPWSPSSNSGLFLN
jgi:hypothetical protein